MLRAWYMDDDPNEPSLEHHKNPPEFVSLEDLYKNTGVEYIALNAKTYETDGVLDKLKKERGYTYEDELVCTRGSPDCEEKLKAFYTEHLHSDEEIRFIYDGAGYFDVRDQQDRWIRIAVGAGDLIVLPSGIYHRFTLDLKNRVKMKRLFIGHPVWRAYNRPCDQMQCRQTYVQAQQDGFAAHAY